jgi:hypothetical protein
MGSADSNHPRIHLTAHHRRHHDSPARHESAGMRIYWSMIQPRIQSTGPMRILKRLLILSVLVPLAACGEGTSTLPETDPIHGSWSMPMTLFRGTGEIDRAEHRYTFSPDGTYEAATIGFDDGRVVYQNEVAGEYRLEPGGIASNVQTWRWRAAETPLWQNEVVGDKGVFAPPIPFTVNGHRLIFHLGPSQGEHSQPIPAEDRVYTRR